MNGILQVIVRCRQTVLAVCLVVLAIWPNIGRAYDPLDRTSGGKPTVIDLTVHDSGRQRDLPIRVYLPTNTVPEPVVFFSHGLGGSREGSAFLGEHWAARGYVVVYVQHPGSDDAVWKDVQPMERLAALRKAASLNNFFLRVKDIPVVLDQLAVWNRQTNHALAGRLDLAHVGMSGHSFGAVTTEAVSGESFPMSGREFTDSRISAAIAFSPSSPEVGRPADAFHSVTIPWMLMTGTKDIAPIGHQDVASRLAVYDNLPRIPKYEVVLNNAEHSVFTDRALPGDQEPRNPNHHRVILALSTAFWDAHLRHDAAALAWLDSEAPRQIMQREDVWRFDSGK